MSLERKLSVERARYCASEVDGRDVGTVGEGFGEQMLEGLFLQASVG